MVCLPIPPRRQSANPRGFYLIHARLVAVRSASRPRPRSSHHALLGNVAGLRRTAVAAAGRAGRLDRSVIRARFELRFSATAMARGYLDVYGDLLVRRPFAESPLPDRVTPLRPLDEARSFALGA